MRSLTMRAVRRRMSLMWSLSPSLGVTLMGMGRLPWSSWVPGCTLGRFGGPLRPGHPVPGQRTLVTAAPDEAHRPARQRADPVLEPREKGDVHAQPPQPADEAAHLDRADLGHGGE